MVFPHYIYILLYFLSGITHITIQAENAYYTNAVFYGFHWVYVNYIRNNRCRVWFCSLTSCDWLHQNPTQLEDSVRYYVFDFVFAFLYLTNRCAYHSIQQGFT